jgi:hypothetical protein
MNSCYEQNNSRLKMWQVGWYSFLGTIAIDQQNFTSFQQIKIPRGKESPIQRSKKKIHDEMIK